MLLNVKRKQLSEEKAESEYVKICKELLQKKSVQRILKYLEDK